MSHDPSLEHGDDRGVEDPAEHPLGDVTQEAAEVAPTGDERVDVALAGLRALADLPVEEHPQVYDRLHAELRAVLDHAGPDDEPA